MFLSPILPSICRPSVTVDRTAPDGITLLFAGIPRVAHHGVDRPILAFLHNSHAEVVALQGELDALHDNYFDESTN